MRQDRSLPPSPKDDIPIHCGRPLSGEVLRTESDP